MSRKKIITELAENNIIEILSTNKGKIMNHKQLFAKLNEEYKPTNAESLLPILYQMVEKGRIEKRDDYKFYKLMVPKLVQGIIDISKNERVFLNVEGMEDDYQVEFSNIKLLPFDLVEAEIKKSGNKNPKANVLLLINHSERVFTGVLQSKNNEWIIIPDNVKFQFPFDVKFDKSLKVNYKVSFKIDSYRKDKKFPNASILEIFGKQGEHSTEMHSILAEFGLPEAFDISVQACSDSISDEITAKDIAVREDFRNTLTFTIDPDTAKDFDDAISYKTLSNGNFEVGVHIADVSHYVLPNTILDSEALKRATSVYLVDRVVPMLPFKLSDVICSLVPNKDRLTFAAIFEVSPKFEIINTRFAKTIIHSDKRFSYEEAQAILNAGAGIHFSELLHLNTFAKYLAEKRFQNGAINFESNEFKFVLDDNFKPISMQVKVHQDTNKLIEELMLLANKSVAEFMYKQKPRPPFVYRTHDEPSEMRLLDLKRFVAKFGYTIHIDDEKSLRKSINDISKEVEGKPEQDVVRTMCIRSMAKALYTPNKPEHFGLAFNYYTHFTSPIRRYPDVIVHRLLYGFLQNKSMEQVCGWNMAQLDGACKQSSKMEQLASNAERASIKYKQAEWMESNIGKQFEGVITGLTDWGMFVEIKDYKCEGLVRLNTIKDDHYTYDSHLMSLIGSRFFKQYKMGDVLQVVVKASNKISRTIDLQLIETERKERYGRNHDTFRRR
ncbi:MAG: ribonuclease R [Bacteroidetes bacterium]|nr:ribonuclease R [Bacteroidota bacterium]